jgi:hypothetical protein
MSKAISRLITLAVVGFIIWWLAGQFGMLNPTGKSAQGGAGPALKLVDVSIRPPDVTKSYGDRFQGSFVIVNEGESPARNCTLMMIDGSSDRFELAPLEKRKIRAASKTVYRKSSSANVSVRVSCAGYRKTLFSQGYSF